MVNGILSLLRDIREEKQAELEKDHYSRCEEIERQLAKDSPKFRELTNKINLKELQIEKLREEIGKLRKTKNKLFPGQWDAKEKAAEILKEDYLKLRVKTTLDGIPKEKVKKLVEEFQKKDYLAIAMGA